MRPGNYNRPVISHMHALFQYMNYFNSQSTSCMTSISENEVKDLNPLSDVHHLNGILKIYMEMDNNEEQSR